MMTMHAMLGWSLFAAVVTGMLLLDLGVFHRKAHAVGFREASAWSVVWIVLALVFAGFVWKSRGHDDAVLFTTSWLVEWSLSLDNIFVFMIIFTYFRVPDNYRHRLLFYGIVGSVITRGLFIVAGIAIIQRFSWITYVLGAFLVFTGGKLALGMGEEIHPERNPVLRLFRRFFPVAEGYGEGRFFVREAGRTLATPLFVVLLVVETTDVVFAVDSVPAVLAITADPFLVYTSNVFAILGLRSLYFALSGTMAQMRFLSYGLAAILSFVGAKMLLASFVHVPPLVSLAVIGVVLVVAIAASVLFPGRDDSQNPG